MVRAKYESMISDLESFLKKNKMVHTWDTFNRNITLTVRPSEIGEEQTSFIEDEERNSYDASISFVFKNGELIINTTGRMFVSEEMMNKLKNIAKKLHYLHLWTFHEETMMCRGKLCVSENSNNTTKACEE